MGWLASSLSSLSFGTAGTGGNDNQLDFTANPRITAIGPNAFKGTKFSTIDLTALTKLENVGNDAFSNIIGLTEVKLSQDQAATINPAVFSGVDEGGDADTSWGISITNGSSGSSQTSYTPTTWPSTTVTPANNLNRLDKIQTIDLSAAPITTLQGGVLFNNPSITKLVLPATASNWKVTEVGEYGSAPVGNMDSSKQKLTELEFLNFATSNTPATDFSQINWSQVANILNMFGYVKDGESTNLAIWADNFSDTLLDASSVKSGWKKNGNGDPVDLSNAEQNQPYTKTVNNLTWKYTATPDSITLTVESPGKAPNLYRAGYTNNPYATYQVGFAADFKAEVQVTLTLVSQTKR